ncbi:MAG TPA: hypothetical protein QF630_09070, partial [Alphaproteobacteria bacterium]|nr:hypothetical protein [Alphaproteobacteria bacterium]
SSTQDFSVFHSSPFEQPSWNSVFDTGGWGPSSVGWKPNWDMTQLTSWQANTEYGSVEDFLGSPASAALRNNGYQPYNTSLLSDALRAAMPGRRTSFLRPFSPPNDFVMMARGGRALFGAPVIVGERGPEIFVRTGRGGLLPITN